MDQASGGEPPTASEAGDEDPPPPPVSNPPPPPRTRCATPAQCGWEQGLLLLPLPCTHQRRRPRRRPPRASQRTKRTRASANAVLAQAPGRREPLAEAPRLTTGVLLLLLVYSERLPRPGSQKTGRALLGRPAGAARSLSRGGSVGRRR
jgi:hypothetical protein